MSTSNGKRMQPNSRIKDNLSHQHLPPVQQQQQEELIKFICDSWNKVCQEYQKGNAQGTPTVAYHTETEPNPMLKGGPSNLGGFESFLDPFGDDHIFSGGLLSTEGCWNKEKNFHYPSVLNRPPLKMGSSRNDPEGYNPPRFDGPPR